MKSVAIEREFGSGGRDIGIRIAKEAQIPYYDGQLLIEAAKGLTSITTARALRIAAMV